MQFYPAGKQPQWLYGTEINRVVRYAYKVGDAKPSGQAEVVVPQLADTTQGHSTRDLVFSLDGKRMFVAVGSQSNVAEDMPKKSAADQDVEAEHGVGAAWGKRRTAQMCSCSASARSQQAVRDRHPQLRRARDAVDRRSLVHD
jgi:glucose/arabinose dehydrogenase